LRVEIAAARSLALKYETGSRHDVDVMDTCEDRLTGSNLTGRVPV
jgi:hypothetical protein